MSGRPTLVHTVEHPCRVTDAVSGWFVGSGRSSGMACSKHTAPLTTCNVDALFAVVTALGCRLEVSTVDDVRGSFLGFASQARHCDAKCVAPGAALVNMCLH